jgi:hypothetical protein
VSEDDGLALSRGELRDAAPQRRTVEDALGALRGGVVDDLVVPGSDAEVAVAVGAALPDPVDGPALRDRPDPRDDRVAGVVAVGDQPDLEEDVLHDLLGLTRVVQLVPHVPLDERTEAVVQCRERPAVTGRHGEHEVALFRALGEEFVVHIRYFACCKMYSQVHSAACLPPSAIPVPFAAAPPRGCGPGPGSSTPRRSSC